MKKDVVVYVERNLTAYERKNFKKEHPGKRLCFRLRFPDLPLFISVISLLLVLAKIFLPGMH